ncbi:MAG TPA: type II toxin-antitoxin system Phd/YefM family antitoxin [Candidatus Limnocylindrales bacterium]|nr:type II toxin-antitoxin system Phd/YefM family antitoxin [Candidatus Limnocylindrales bacterium]
MSEIQPTTERTVTISRFKAECLAILDQVDQLKISIVITKHGRPVARVVPAEASVARAGLAGSVTLIAADDGAYYSTGRPWNDEPLSR